MNRFITFEGIDGTGKTTQIKRLAAALTGDGYTVCRTYEPGGSPIGADIRSILLDKSRTELTAQTETLLYFADRREHLQHIILPALRRGEIVLCDRFLDATYAYQTGGRQLPAALVDRLSEEVVGEAMPQLTFLFDCPPEVVIDRIRRRGKPNRFDSQTAPFYERVRQCYLRRAQSDPERFVTIDAAAEPDATHQVLRQTLTERGVY